MSILDKLIYTGAIMGIFFGLIMAITSIGDDDKRIERINDIFTGLAGICFISTMILVIIRLLMIIWR